MNDGTRVRRFAVRALEASGSRVELLDDDTVQVELSPLWCRRWRCPPRQIFTFSRDGMLRRPGARLMAPGCDWLADLIAWGQEKGAAGGLFCPLGLDPACVAGLVAAAEGKPVPWAPLAAQRFARALAGLRLANGCLRLKGWRLVYQRQVLFAFRVSLMADSGEDAVVQVLIDPVTEEAEALPEDVRWSAFPLAATAGTPGDVYRVRRLYRSAQRALPRAVRSRWNRFRAAVEARYEQERARLQAYYDELEFQAREPVERWALRRERERMLEAVWGLNPRGYEEAPAEGTPEDDPHIQSQLRAYEARLAEIREERERRLQELRERYAARITARLVYGAVVVIPRVEVEWRTGHPRRRCVTAFFDLVRGRWVDWRCEACDRPLSAETDRLPYVLADGSILCPHCLQLCGGCGRPMERGEAAALCHVCESPLCPDCRRPCQLAAGGPDRVSTRVQRARDGDLTICPECRVRYCGLCVSLARSGTGSGPGWGQLVAGKAFPGASQGAHSAEGVTRGRQKIQAAMVSF